MGRAGAHLRLRPDGGHRRQPVLGELPIRSFRKCPSEQLLALGVPSWVLALVMPLGFLLVALRAIRGAGARTRHRLAAAAILAGSAGFELRAESRKGRRPCGSASP